jgi:hypothetical protein
MANTIQHKRSNTPSSIPGSSSLSYGELAINYTDGKVYTKNNNNNIINLAASSISGVNINPGLITTNSGLIISTGGGIARLYASLGNEVDNSNIYFDTDSDTDLHVAYKESTTHVGTTAITLNRSSAAQTLSGVSIDGNAATVTNGVYTTSNQSVGGVKTFTNQIINTTANNTNAGGGQIYLNGATGNRIDFNTNGVGAPNLFSRTLGTKINLYPSLSTGSATDFAIGLANDGAGAPTRFWNSINSSSSRFEWFAGGTNISALTGSGVFTVAGATSQINVDNLRLDGNTFSATNSNGSLIIAPNGTGALVGSTTGNARGTNAVDLQNKRTAVTQVASGANSVIGGGQNNTSIGSSSTVGGGQFNTSNGFVSTVGGGQFNTSSGGSSTVGGGKDNNASGEYSTIGGGYSYYSGNLASGNCSTIGGGGGGYYAFQAAAYVAPQNISSGYLSTIAGGSFNNAVGYFSCIPGGLGAKTSIPGELAHSAGIFSQPGDAQHSIFILKGTTTNATPLNLLAGTSALVTNFQQEIIIPSERIFSGTINIIGTRNTGANVARYLRQFTIKNVGGTPSLVGSIITLGTDVADGTSISITAVNSTPDVLRIAVTGKASENWRWVAVVDCVSVQFEPL